MSSIAAPVKPEEVILAACHAFGIAWQDFIANGRHPRVVNTREVAWWVCRRITTASFPEIAAASRRPSHATIVTAIKRIRKRVESGDPTTIDQVATLVSMVEPRRFEIPAAREEVSRGE